MSYYRTLFASFEDWKCTYSGQFKKLDLFIRHLCPHQVQSFENSCSRLSQVRMNFDIQRVQYSQSSNKYVPLRPILVSLRGYHARTSASNRNHVKQIGKNFPVVIEITNPCCIILTQIWSIGHMNSAHSFLKKAEFSNARYSSMQDIMKIKSVNWH